MFPYIKISLHVLFVCFFPSFFLLPVHFNFSFLPLSFLVFAFPLSWLYFLFSPLSYSFISLLFFGLFSSCFVFPIFHFLPLLLFSSSPAPHRAKFMHISWIPPKAYWVLFSLFFLRQSHPLSLNHLSSEGYKKIPRSLFLSSLLPF